METVELEKSYLAKYVPNDLADLDYLEISDKYFPVGSLHPGLRLRRRGEKFEITKKRPISEGELSKQTENTIPLTREEYDGLNAAPGSSFLKRRYQYSWKGNAAEVDIYQEALSGLVVVDFEFEDEAARDVFEMPDFCLVEATSQVFLAGGMLAGKSYADLAVRLEGLGYKALKNPG